MLLRGKELKLKYFQGNDMCFFFTNVCLQIGKTAKLLLETLDKTSGNANSSLFWFRTKKKIIFVGETAHTSIVKILPL